MAGTDAAGPGMAAAHFTPSVLLNFSGRPVSGLEPSWFGPRNPGQFAALAVKVVARKQAGNRTESFMGVRDLKFISKQETP
jgi:hypothetical protein